ncbi:hypothetical protein G7Y89_g11229 [Cudoniella acicularis]|uniref:Rhodopsin domain-containing protein n=1 Tax=Cudoniella acicularis TaxID=354080 RepID=A0A8H4RDI9_9HELO|nr:hypothetical protein G7Y89_g11229 [Cudoniella acicularis]
MIILAVPFTLAFSILQMYQTKNGSGYHMWDVTLSEFNIFFFIGGIWGSFLYGIGTLFIKASILFFYLRLPSKRLFKIITYLVMFVMCGYCLFGAFTWLFMCRPIEKYWNLEVAGTCLNFKTAFLVGGSMNVVTDVVMLLLPIWVLRPLQLPLRQKLGVIVILMTGSLVCVVSAVRLAKIPSTLVNPDFTWVGTDGFVWCIVEMYVGIICACLPALKTIMKYHYPGSFNDDSHYEIPDLEASPKSKDVTSNSGNASSNPSSIAMEDRSKVTDSSTSSDENSVRRPEQVVVTGSRTIEELVKKLYNYD